MATVSTTLCPNRPPSTLTQPHTLCLSVFIYLFALPHSPLTLLTHPVHCVYLTVWFTTTVNLCWCRCVCFLPPVSFSLSPSSPIINLTSDLSPYVTALYVSDLLSISLHLPLPPSPLQAGTMAVWVGSRLRLSCSAAGKPASWWETANQEPASTPSLWSECARVCVCVRVCGTRYMHAI